VASLLTHPVVPLSIGVALGRRNIPLRALFLGIVLSMLPDADVIAFRLGIPYEHMLGHRGLSHSLAFAAVAAFTGAALPASQGMRFRLFLFFAVATISHGILDAMTTGGEGVGFFIPFDAHRYFLPLRPIPVSPIGVKGFLSPRGWVIFRSELLWVWLPCLATAVMIAIYRRRVTRA